VPMLKSGDVVSEDERKAHHHEHGLAQRTAYAVGIRV